MNYLVVDIETTSVNLERAQILQIAALYMKDGREHASFNVLVDNGVITYGDYGALAMNSRIFAELSKPAGGYKIMKLLEARDAFESFLVDLRNEDEKVARLTLAGKNAATFDLPILSNNSFTLKEHIKHRVLDVGSLYAPDFGYMPTLNEVNRLLNRKSVTHDALDDCRDVAFAIEQKLASIEGEK